MTEENDISTGLIIFLIIYLAIANHIIYKFLMSRIVEEAVSMVVDTSNDDILKPFTYFCFNLVTFICPVVLSYIKNVLFLHLEIILRGTILRLGSDQLFPRTTDYLPMGLQDES